MTTDNKLSLSNDNILLRGMTLRNTPGVVGCVIYTGHDTKIQMNNAKAKYKSSKIMKKTNLQVIYIFIADMLISAISAAFGAYW